MREKGILCYSDAMRKRKRNKDNLILFDESKRVIRFRKPGSDRGRKKVGALITAALAVICAIYFLAIYFFMGYGSYFFLIWAVMAMGFGVWSVVLFCPKIMQKIPNWFCKFFQTCVIIGLVLLAVVEGMIFSQVGAKASGGADYVIILGAQWKSTGPSYILKQRLDTALEYLQENPDTKVIVSGGQGVNEPISEAAGMAGYLEASGIAPERILLENASTSTDENLEFSADLLQEETENVVIVSSNYHMFRALQLAEKKGYKNVQGLAAPSHVGMLPNNLVREFLAVVKDFIVGNI